MIISPFSPIFFYPQGKMPKSDGTESPYVQTFSPSDRILVEAIASTGETPSFLIEKEGSTPVRLEPSDWDMAEGRTLYYVTLQGLSEGAYQIREEHSGVESHPFRISADPSELSATTLIQYSMADNKQRSDAVFSINGMRAFFDFRVPGGFKDSEISFGCESEQFETQSGDICTLYAIESTTRKFTLGGQEGVPARFGELLNRLLCCTYVYFDGVRHVRKDSAVPEINVQIEGVDSFVFKQSLRKVPNPDPATELANLALIRRIETSQYRSAQVENQQQILFIP